MGKLPTRACRCAAKGLADGGRWARAHRATTRVPPLPPLLLVAADGRPRVPRWLGVVADDCCELSSPQPDGSVGAGPPSADFREAGVEGMGAPFATRARRRRRTSAQPPADAAIAAAAQATAMPAHAPADREAVPPAAAPLLAVLMYRVFPGAATAAAALAPRSVRRMVVAFGFPSVPAGLNKTAAQPGSPLQRSAACGSGAATTHSCKPGLHARRGVGGAHSVGRLLQSALSRSSTPRGAAQVAGHAAQQALAAHCSESLQA